MAVHSPLLLLVPLLAPPAQELPFESLGKALLAQADARGGTTKPVRAGPVPAKRALLTRLAALHQRLRLGAVEIWLPRVAIEVDGALAAAPEAKAFQNPARMLLSLERAWLARGAADAVDLAQAAPAIGRLEGWIRAFKGDEAPEQEPEVVAGRRLLSILLLHRRGAAPPPDQQEDYDLVVIVAPTRAHYVAVLGAAGIVDPARVADLWSPAARRSSGVIFESNVALVATALASPEDSPNPLESWAMSAADVAQGIVHAADHLLAIRIVPAAPPWFVEGLAICDTVDVSRADETLCSGHREYASIPGNVAGGPSTLLVWVTQDKSPFRGRASSRHFVKVLRGFLARSGVSVLDLDTGRTAFTLDDPLLGRRAAVPQQVEHGSEGVKKGFAELYRAWCAAFVHYLSELETPGGRALPLVLAHLREASMGAAEIAEGALEAALVAVTGKGLETADAEKDLEVAFAAWLASQR